MNKCYRVWDGLTGREVFFFTEEAARCYYGAAVNIAYKNEKHLFQLELVAYGTDGKVVSTIDVIEKDEFGIDNKEAV